MTDIPTITQEEAVEVRARELLAAEVSNPDLAKSLRNREPMLMPGTVYVSTALRAIIAALSPNMDHAVGGVRAWQYELATRRDKSTGEYSGWEARLTTTPPSVPEGSVRNLTPLAPAAAPPVNQDAVREAAEEFANSPDAPWLSNHHSTWVDPEAAFVAGANWQAALSTPPLDNTGLDAATVERPDGAIENLTNFQQQADMHGEFVKVSRQALDETLAYVAALASGDRS